MNACGADAVRALIRYLVASVALHLAWEVLQLPLYTIWSSGTFRDLAFAVFHCTVGDGMIAGITLLLGFAVVGHTSGPNSRLRAVWLVSLVLGIGYTVFSEWINVKIRSSWDYSPLMPKVPFLGTGLSPILQWIIVPTMALWIAVRRAPWVDPAD